MCSGDMFEVTGTASPTTSGAEVETITDVCILAKFRLQVNTTVINILIPHLSSCPFCVTIKASRQHLPSFQM